MNYESFERVLTEKKISRRKLADMIGVNVNTFLSALGRKSDLDADTILKIAEALGIDFTELSLSSEQWQAYQKIQEENMRRSEEMKRRIEQDNQERLKHWKMNIAAKNEDMRIHRVVEIMRTLDDYSQIRGVEFFEDMAANPKNLKKNRKGD